MKMIFRPCYNSDLQSWKTCNMEKHRALIQVTEDLSKKEEPPPFFTLCEEIPETRPTWAGFRGIKT